MLDRIPVTAWFPSQDPADCPLCRDARAALHPEALRAAGEIAVGIMTRGSAVQLAEATVTRLASALGSGRVTILAPEAGGRWRVAVSSDLRDTLDLMVDTERYPELLEVRRSGTPYLAPDVEQAPELERARPFLAAAGVRCIAAYPVFMAPGGVEPVVMKVSLFRRPEPSHLLLATLVAHLLVHRFTRQPPAGASHLLGVAAPAETGYDPMTILRLLPLPAMVVDDSGRVLHANSRALWLWRGHEPDGAGAPIMLRMQPSRPWMPPSARWEAQLLAGKRTIAVLGWSNPVGTARTLILLEPHPDVRRRSNERAMRRTLAEKLKELEAANARLEEHARLRERFVSDAAHELKTPLAILRSYIETLADDLVEGLTADQREFLAAAAHGARRLQRLVEQLLDLAALEAGHLPVAVGQVSSREVAAAVADELRPLADAGRVTLRAGVEPDLEIRADPARLRQVLRNLVENGIKYTAAGGEISIGSSRIGDRAVLCVADTGIGIPPESLPRVFDEFVRIPGHQPVDGAGLGLAIVRRLALAMGGQVWAESTPGVGSRFFVELPLWTGEG